jgi:hypothetical protein
MKYIPTNIEPTINVTGRRLLAASNGVEFVSYTL